MSQATVNVFFRLMTNKDTNTNTKTNYPTSHVAGNCDVNVSFWSVTNTNTNTNTKTDINKKTKKKIAWMANYPTSHVAGNYNVNVFLGLQLIMNTQTNGNTNTKTNIKANTNTNTKTAWMAKHPQSYVADNCQVNVLFVSGVCILLHKVYNANVASNYECFVHIWQQTAQGSQCPIIRA